MRPPPVWLAASRKLGKRPRIRSLTHVLRLLGQREAEVVASLGVIRLDLERPLEMGNRFTPPFLLTQRDPQTIMRLGGIRAEFKRPLETGDGLSPLRLLTQREPQVAQS